MAVTRRSSPEEAMDARARLPRRARPEATEPCPWRPSVFPVGSFREHGPLQRQAAEKARKANRRAAHTHVPPGYQGRVFSSRRGCPPTVRRHILVRSFQEEKPQLRRRQRPVMRGARPRFHGAITARSGVNSRSLSCQENSAQDRSVAPAAEAGALESLAVSMMRRRWLGSAESAFAGWLPSLSILFIWTA
jgi:hypothetical protein